MRYRFLKVGHARTGHRGPWPKFFYRFTGGGHLAWRDKLLPLTQKANLMAALTADSLVWAKVRGYPWWPGRVNFSISGADSITVM